VKSGIAAVRSKAVGHYALAIKHNDTVCIFTDPLGGLSLYYADTGSFWFVSNSLSLCAGVLPNRRLDATKLLVAAIRTSLPGEDTFYSSIQRLFGTQQVRIDLNSGKLRVGLIGDAAPDLSWNLPTIQDALDQYKGEVQAVFRELSGAGPVGLFATGGMDSRTILAALVDQQTPVQLMYGVGNSRMTDYHDSDLSAAKAMADVCGLPLQELDWSGNQPHSEETLRELFQTYGFMYEIYGAPESFLRAFNGGISPYPKLLLGAYCPAFARDKPWEFERKPFSFDHLVGDCMTYVGGNVDHSRCIVCKDTYRSVFASEIRTGLQRGGIAYPVRGASLETFVRAKLFLYIRDESRFLNFANEFCHYIAPFLQKRLYEPLLSVPFEFRAKDEFQIRLIHSLAPGLIDVPLHTGGWPAHINRETFHLVRDHSGPKKSLGRRVARAIVPSVLHKPVRAIYSRAGLSKKRTVHQLTGRDRAIVDAYSQQVMQHPLGRRWFSDTYEFTPKVLARIWHYLVGVNVLGYSE
jgi:hypothetical protein